MKLLLCAGTERRDGWLTLDGNAAFQPDILATMPPLPPEVKVAKWDAIEWIHGPASLYPWQAADLFRELRGVMAPDGMLALETPDLRKAAQAVLDDLRWTYWLYGDPQHLEPGYMNHWGYTPETLTAAVRLAGFTRFELAKAQHHHPGRDFRLEARP
jgi:hypothetical protein